MATHAKKEKVIYTEREESIKRKIDLLIDYYKKNQSICDKFVSEKFAEIARNMQYIQKNYEAFPKEQYEWLEKNKEKIAPDLFMLLYFYYQKAAYNKHVVSVFNNMITMCSQIDINEFEKIRNKGSKNNLLYKQKMLEILQNVLGDATYQVQIDRMIPWYRELRKFNDQYQHLFFNHPNINYFYDEVKRGMFSMSMLNNTTLNFKDKKEYEELLDKTIQVRKAHEYELKMVINVIAILATNHPEQKEEYIEKLKVILEKTKFLGEKKQLSNIRRLKKVPVLKQYIEELNELVNDTNLKTNDFIQVNDSNIVFLEVDLSTLKSTPAFKENVNKYIMHSRLPVQFMKSDIKKNGKDPKRGAYVIIYNEDIINAKDKEKLIKLIATISNRELSKILSKTYRERAKENESEPIELLIKRVEQCDLSIYTARCFRLELNEYMHIIINGEKINTGVQTTNTIENQLRACLEDKYGIKAYNGQYNKNNSTNLYDFYIKKDDYYSNKAILDNIFEKLKSYSPNELKSADLGNIFDKIAIEKETEGIVKTNKRVVKI